MCEPPGVSSQLAVASEARYRPKPPKLTRPSDAEVQKILALLDGEGRWTSTYQGEHLTGQPKFAKGQEYLASAVFSENLRKLSEWVAAKKAAPKK